MGVKREGAERVASISVIVAVKVAGAGECRRVREEESAVVTVAESESKRNSEGEKEVCEGVREGACRVARGRECVGEAEYAWCEEAEGGGEWRGRGCIARKRVHSEPEGGHRSGDRFWGSS